MGMNFTPHSEFGTSGMPVGVYDVRPYDLIKRVYNTYVIPRACSGDTQVGMERRLSTTRCLILACEPRDTSV